MSTKRKHPKYEDITSRWGGMKIRVEFEKCIDDWLKEFPVKNHPFLLELLSNFYYYCEEEIKKKVQELYKAFVDDYYGDLEEVVFTKVYKEYGLTGFSDILFMTFWNNNCIQDYSVNDISGLLELGQVPKVLSIVEDYSGTGNTIIKTIDKMIQINEELQNTKIYILVLHITKRALEKIKEYAEKVGLDVKIIYLDYSEETFKKNYIYNEIEAEIKKRYYNIICKNKGVTGEYVFGYEEVASLVAFHYNTPNNTLGLFWKDMADFSTIFPRNKRKRTNLRKMQQEAKIRKSKKEPPVIYGLEDGKMTVMLTYCIGREKGISIGEFMDTFGLTTEQADDALRGMIQQGYVINSSGKYIPTVKLKSKLFSSRIKKGQNRFKKEKQKIEEKTIFDIHNEYIPCNFE